MYVCTRCLAFFSGGPLSVVLVYFFFANYTRTADDIASKHTAQGRAISSADVTLGVVKSLVAPNLRPRLSSPWHFVVFFLA